MHRGIIPACAGSTLDLIDTATGNRDHPRMCGEHATPRTDTPDSTGIIPACAGSTLTLAVSRSRARDHPRMCGEHNNVSSDGHTLTGSSPHVRGAQQSAEFLAVRPGIIPACAGSTETGRCGQALPWDHPRMCGEHYRLRLLPRLKTGSSPHVRGAPGVGVDVWFAVGIIPACAGSTSA